MVIADPKSQELLELLKRERSLVSPTTQDRINYRHQVENILGPDENVFRIDWVGHHQCYLRTLMHDVLMFYYHFQLSEPKTLTIQLIGKDDATFDDSEAFTGRWQAYMDSYNTVRSVLRFLGRELTFGILAGSH